jgi:Zn-dependent protease
VFKLSIGYDCADLSYKKEALVCLGGVVFNFLFAILALFLTRGTEAGRFLIVCNLSLGLMNLYPVSILDGGRIVKALLFSIFTSEKAEKISRYVSFFSAFLLWLVATYLQLIFSANISLFFVSVFLLIQLCFSI